MITSRSIALLSLCLFLLALLPPDSSAQPGELLWEVQIGNDDNDGMGDVEFCANGDLLVTSRLQSNDMMLDKMSSEGAHLWTQQTQGHHGRVLERIGRNRFATTYSEPMLAVLNFRTGFEFLTDVAPGWIHDVGRHQQGTFVSCGDMTHRTFVSRYSDSGSLMWTTLLGGIVNQHCYSVNSTVTGLIHPVVTSYGIIVYDISPSGTIEDSTVFIRQNGLSVHASYHSEVLPDGNLLIAGQLAMDADSMYSGLTLSPDGEIINYWGHQGMSLGPYFPLYGMPDGGSISYRHHDGSNLEFTRYDATGTPLFTWDYYCTVEDCVYIERDIAAVSRLGEIVVFGEYGVGEFETNVFLAKFSAGHTDLEISARPNRSLNSVHPPNRFTWHGTLTNNTDVDIVTDVWVIVRGPAGYPSESLRVWEDITVPANGTYEADLQQSIPANTASGEYNYIVRAGAYTDNGPQHTIQAFFPFTVTGGTEVDFDPPRHLDVVAAPFEGPKLAMKQ